jgi:hypothetical protein
MTKTGPNNAGRAILIGTFLIFIRVFYMLTNIFKLYLCIEGTRRMGMGGGDEKWPKRHVWCHLASKYLRFFFLSSCFLHAN